MIHAPSFGMGSAIFFFVEGRGLERSKGCDRTSERLCPQLVGGMAEFMEVVPGI